MKPVLVFVFAVLFTVLVSAADSWLFETTTTTARPTDLPGSGLTDLYNKKVIKAEIWERPLSGWEDIYGILKHNGVVITTEDDERWLVHKGPNFGQKHDTVITRASNMGSDWEWVEEKTIRHSQVYEYIAAGGENYNLALDNCQDATRRMWRLN